MKRARSPSVAARRILAAKGACRPLNLDNVQATPGKYSGIFPQRKDTFQPVLRSPSLGEVLPDARRNIWHAAHTVRLRLSTCPPGTEGVIEHRGSVIAKWVRSEDGIVAGTPNPFARFPDAILAALDGTPEEDAISAFHNVARAAKAAGVVIPRL